LSEDVVDQPLFTVFTATYNRARTLPRLYESLRSQTLQDFEWLIVDDGSTDETSRLVSAWVDARELTIRYIKQASNRGKHVCINLALEVARGRFLATIDSDDWYLPHALETFAEVWRSIPSKEYSKFAGVSALAATPSGSVIGTRFPRDVLDASYTELNDRYRIVGDKAGCGRVDVDRLFPFPVIDGERMIIEDIVYRRIARHYRLRCVNKVLLIKDYQPDGLTAQTGWTALENPRTVALALRELLHDGENLPRWNLLRVYVNYLRYSMHGHSGSGSFEEIPSKLLAGLTLPVALGLYARDRWRLARGRS
jgi:glycosyltransferase involved in cell wall biosynthesis